MTTNQTIDGVSRELLESFAAYVADSPNAIMRARVKELRDLLDAKSETVAGHHPARPQSELVAWMYKRKDQSEYGKPSQHIAFASTDLEECRTGKNVEGRVIFTPRDDYFDWKPLYTEQPATVAVVLPERREEVGTGGATYYIPVGWNACIEALKRLNPSL